MDLLKTSTCSYLISVTLIVSYKSKQVNQLLSKFSINLFDDLHSLYFFSLEILSYQKKIYIYFLNYRGHQIWRMRDLFIYLTLSLQNIISFWYK